MITRLLSPNYLINSYIFIFSQEWQADAPPSALPADPSTLSQRQTQDPHNASAETNSGQEPMRRRRRKRKRRPQQQPPQQLMTQQQQEDEPSQPAPSEPAPTEIAEIHVSMKALEPKKYWRAQIDDDSQALEERGGIMVSINNNGNPPSIAPQMPLKLPIAPVPTNTWNNELQQPFQGDREKGEAELHAELAPDRSYRKPYTVGRRAEAEASGKSGGSAALKNLLKNSGGLSLSELLQQQNLSLEDLLKGKQTALKALQSTSEVSNGFDETSSPGSRRIPSMHIRPTALPGSEVDEEDHTMAVTPRRIPAQPQQRPTGLPGSEPIVREIPAKPARWKPSVEDTTPAAPRRLPNFTVKVVDIPIPTAPSPAPHEITEAEGHIVGTMASFLIPRKPTSVPEKHDSLQPTRRLPSTGVERVKAIKGVASAIRPDLFNSSTRKRVPMIKSSPDPPEEAPHPTTAYPQMSETKANKYPPRLAAGHRLRPITPDDSIAAHEKADASTEVTTTPKAELKNRLRPRLKSLYASTTTTTTTAKSTEPSLFEIIETTPAADTEETTIQPIYDQPDNVFGPSNVNSRESTASREIVETYEPEINLIEQLPAIEEAAAESGSNFGSAEAVESIEQLFALDFNEPGNNPIDAAIDQETNQPHNHNAGAPNAKIDVTERNPSLFLDITSSRTVDDRTDILELLEDRRNGARLAKVLAQRNMSLSELIEHRERGSSQLHLAEIFNNKSQNTNAEPVPSPAAPMPTFQTLDVVTAFENFPSFDLGNVKSVQPDDIKTDSEGSSYFTSIIQIKPTDDTATKEGRALIPKFRLDSATIKSSSDFYQSWESNSLDVEPSSTTTTTRRSIASFPRITTASPLSTHPAPHLVDSIDMDTNNVYKGVEQIETNSGRTQDIIDLELSGHGYKRQPIGVDKQQLPVGVRSAIIASGSIVGVSLLIFAVIFATCRWRQRRKKTFRYAENFQAVRSRLPILTARESARSSREGGGGSGEGGSSKRSTSPPMVFHTNASGSMRQHHGGDRDRMSRCSKINTMDPNSPEVQEYLYDAMRQPFQ